jgi:hypothetical protein
MTQLPSDATAYRFFLEEWNSFLYLAASKVAFSWEEDVPAPTIDEKCKGQ